MPKEKDFAVDIDLAFSVDRKDLNVNILSDEEMCPSDWAEVLHKIADTIESEGDKIYTDSDVASEYHN